MCHSEHGADDERTYHHIPLGLCKVVQCASRGLPEWCVTDGDVVYCYCWRRDVAAVIAGLLSFKFKDDKRMMDVMPVEEPIL